MTRGIAPGADSMAKCAPIRLIDCLDREDLNPVTVSDRGPDLSHISDISNGEVYRPMSRPIFSFLISDLVDKLGGLDHSPPRKSVFSTVLAVFLF